MEHWALGPSCFLNQIKSMEANSKRTVLFSSLLLQLDQKSIIPSSEAHLLGPTYEFLIRNSLVRNWDYILRGT
jgi:hypothetical protein